MFERFKRRARQKAREIAVQQIRESSEEGRIRTGSVAVCGLLLLGVMMTSHGYSEHSESHGDVNINIYNYYKED